VSRSPRITYAVIGHNEADFLPNALAQARESARPDEPLWFVDSSSTDGSAELASGLGAGVIHAPLGKGRAVMAAVERCETSHICLMDADLESTTLNAPLALRETLERGGADMVVAEFDWPAKPFRPVTTSIWRPLAGAFFPEAVASAGRVPLSGFRVLDVELARGPLPPGFGLEVHLDIVGSLEGRRTETVDIGVYTGTVRNNPGVAREIAGTILTVAERYGRLDPRDRTAWDEWLEPVLALMADTTTGGPERRALLADAAARPLPTASARS
jgi:glucosyl-3-phosphoglycerate synthase